MTLHGCEMDATFKIHQNGKKNREKKTNEGKKKIVRILTKQHELAF